LLKMLIFCVSLLSVSVGYQYEWRGCIMHRDHFLIYVRPHHFILPVVPYSWQSTVFCVTESDHDFLVP
jgi:hypothetical protein